MSYNSSDKNVWANPNEQQAQYSNSPPSQSETQEESPPTWFTGQLQRFGQTLETMVADMIARGQLQTQQYVQSALSSVSPPQAPSSAPPPPPSIPVQPAVQPSAAHAHRLTVKLNPPCMYNGKAEEVKLFIGECEAHIKFYMVDFPSNDHKILFTASYLKDGNLQNWYLGLQRTNAAEVHDWVLFKRSLRTHFVTYDVAARAYDKLRALKQTGPAAAHVARFNELVVDVDISETNRFTIFKEGLKYKL